MLNGDTLTFASLFAGTGGFDLGFERAGMRCVWQCEIDSYCQRVLEKHWPDVFRVPDIRDVNAAVVSGVDVLCGGFPCQDLSVAGRRAGLAGERSGLFFEFARCADELVRPGGWIVVENVPGLLSSQRGRDFAIVVRSLGDIGFHDLAWRVLDSRYFGVPQRRRRVYIVARRAVGSGAREVLLEPESGGGDFAPSEQAGTRIAATATRGTSSPGVSAPGRRQEDDENLIAYALRRDPGGTGQGHNTNYVVGALDQSRGGADDNSAQVNHLVAHTLTADGFDASEDGTGRGTPLTLSGPLAGGNDGAGRRSEDDPNLVCSSPDAHGVRATPGLPGRVDDPVPDGPRYSACGNAVTVNVAHWIGERIVMFEASRDTREKTR